MTDQVKLPVPSKDRRKALSRTFEALASEGPLRRLELRQRLRTSPSTVTDAVTELIELGLVSEAGQAASRGGRPPGLVDLARSAGGVIALDVGGSYVRVAAADLHGVVLWRQDMPTSALMGSEDGDRIKGGLLRVIAEARAAIQGPTHVTALAIAGTVDPTTGYISLTTNIPGWHDEIASSWLSSGEGVVLVDNEANLAALGEHRQGAARGKNDALFIALGAGIGAGLILRNEVYRGWSGAAGEIGLSRRSRGCQPDELERLAGGPAIVQQYRSASGDRSVVTAEEVLARAAAGDASAMQVTAVALEELSIGLANAILLLNPETVILGGGLAMAGDWLAPLFDLVACLVPTAMPSFVRAELGADAALCGAVSWATEHAVGLITEALDTGGSLA